jgi:ubiquinone/menaquinone biosynthesis C-methylase UbiE
MEPRPEQRNLEQLAETLGDSSKMPIEQKISFLKEHGAKIFTNYDFVAPETYTKIFSSTDLGGQSIVIAGAGYPFDKGGTSNVTKALSKIKQDVNIVPLDILHTRARSWLLVDQDNENNETGPGLNPVVADATELPFPNNSITGYVSANLINEPNKELGELKFVRNLIGEAYRVLLPGGFLILSSFGYFKYTDTSGTVFYNDNIDVEEMVPTELVEQMLTEAGFSRVQKLPLDDMEALRALKKKKSTILGITKAQVIDACGYVAYK